MNLSFRSFCNEDRSLLAQYILQLYEEDAAEEEMTLHKIEKTIEVLQTNPKAGNILIAVEGETVIGYAILIRYWSNEYGGWLIFIDEFYVAKAFRGRGVGSKFMNYITNDYFTDVVGFALEVLPGNEGAMALYRRLGFEEDGRSHLFFKSRRNSRIS